MPSSPLSQESPGTTVPEALSISGLSASRLPHCHHPSGSRLPSTPHPHQSTPVCSPLCNSATPQQPEPPLRCSSPPASNLASQGSMGSGHPAICLPPQSCHLSKPHVHDQITCNFARVLSLLPHTSVCTCCPFYLESHNVFKWSAPPSCPALGGELLGDRPGLYPFGFPGTLHMP